MDALPFPVSIRRLLAAALLVVAVVVAVVRHVGHDAGPTALRVAPIRAAAVAAPRAAPRAASRSPSVVVDVEGAVRRPGLVRLEPGARVADAVARAGGTTRAAERSLVNLAAPVSDGQQVLVPRRGSPGAGVSAGAPGGAAPAGAGAGGPVSLSTATAEELDTLPGVGPVTAQKIVDYRTQHGPFRSVDELDAIPGIGPARLSELQGLVVP